jgi:cation diffusion facilitator family transporter
MRNVIRFHDTPGEAGKERKDGVHDHWIHDWQHDHSFGQDARKAGEGRTITVIVITAATMVIEIVAGVVFGSMALLADGLHMASHTAALGISVIAYVYARRHARDERYSFGTGKVNALAAFSSAILLAVFALMMVVESIDRFVNPVRIAFNRAILVACLGLMVNAASVFILGGHHSREDNDHHHDHNLRAAYLHVLADALTSLLAIGALLTAKYAGLTWMDPLMGIVGAILVARWSVGLLREAGHVLLDRQAPLSVRQAITDAIEGRDDNRISDLHVWSIGPNIYAGSIAVVTDEPKQPEYYKSLVPDNLGVVHTTIEVIRRPNAEA